MSPSKSSITTRRIVSGLWSPFKSATKSSSKKVTRPSANFAERQKRQSRPPSCVLPGFQESLMEQFNVGNSKRLNLKHQQNLPLINTANIKDDYDWDFWTSVICNHDQALKNKDLSSQIHKGIPPSLRGTVWQLLSNSTQLAFMKEHHYMDLLRTTSPYDRMIQRDLARTFPNHKYFKEKDGVGQEALYNVVRAYSIHDPEVGYCQGLAFIVGPLLLNMPDEEAICVLIRLMSDYGLRTHFTPNMEGLHLRLYQFESLVAEYLPHISRHLKQHEINPTMFASQWFMTLFAYKFPLDLVFRIYDMVFVEGLDTVLLKFALALLKRNESHLLELDFEPLLNFLKTDLFEEYKDNEQQLIQDTNDWDISRKRLTQLEKEHKVLAAIEEQDAKVLESLQKHQATLRLQVDQLNQSSGVTQKEYQDVQSQLQDSQHLRQQMMDEQGSLKTMVDSLKTETTALPLKVEASFKTEFDNLCNENTRLTQRNAQLEDQLAAMESLLINIKMRYAQSQDEGDDLSKRLFELKKVIS
ncbi:rab-GTPase-TBC domain-containing protein [Chlamydoabsidia padenii]|nr:rab-GTPase-TBC domain-containing protein [Chlamydoabsidia padenii]